METKRKNRRDDGDSKSRRGSAGTGPRLVVIAIVGVTLVFVILAAAGGFAAWHVLRPGPGGDPAVINISGLGGPRGRLVGRWETDPHQKGNGGLPKGAKVTYEFKADGNFTSILDQGTGLPNPADVAKWEVTSESGNVLKLRMRPPLTENQRKHFGDDLNSYNLDVEILSDNQLRVTSFKSMAAVRVFDRKR